VPGARASPTPWSILEANRSMKIHTDAASRLATEVVTQLPVPSRLGMLRFRSG